MDENGLSALHLGNLVDHAVGGAPVKNEACHLLQVGTLGDGDEVLLWQVDQLSLSIILGQACDSVAGLKLGAPAAIGLHSADETVAGRQRWLLLAWVDTTPHVDAALTSIQVSSQVFQVSQVSR